MTLRAVHGNRAEALLGELLAALPPPDPFSPQTIVVGSHVMARWLSREIALARGICAGVDIELFDPFVARVWTGDAAASNRLTALDRGQLAAAIATVLADDRFVATLPPVATYLAGAPVGGDRAGPRRVQLANHVAGLLWQYAVARPDWMPQLFVGRPPSDLSDNATARWQAALFAEALLRLGRAENAGPAATAVPTPMVPWTRRRLQLPGPRLGPVHVFCVSYLQRWQLEALTDLGTTTEVSVYVVDPCIELWDDVAGRKATPAIGEPLLLPLWGRAVRDTMAGLVDRTGGDVESVPNAPSASRTALDQLLADTARRCPPSEVQPHNAIPAGVQVLACANPRRELEVVAVKIRAQLDANPELCAHEAVVWIASDAETYLALAPSAFEAVGIPCHLIDAPLDDRGRVGEAVLALLELPTCAMTRSDLLRVMTHPAVLKRHPHVDVADWVRWSERLGIAHGRDATSHAGTYLADHPNKFHWDQGVRRLALGAYMIGAERGSVRIADIEVMPEEVQADQQASAATYALFVRSLSADAAWLASHRATLVEWAEIFVALVDSYLGGSSSRGSAPGDSSQDMERVRSMLASIARADLDGRRLGFREAREHAIRRIAAARADRGEPLAYGVTISPLRAHRAIPFSISCVVGLNEGQFPASDLTGPLDLRRYAEPRPGDVSARDRDRHAFLDVVLSVRRALYLAYVAVESKSGQPVAPSSVVLELADALAPYLGAPTGRAALEAMTERHPLHRFSVEDLASSAAALRERWAVRVRDSISGWLRARGFPVPGPEGMLALLDHPAMDSLRAELGIVDPACASDPVVDPSVAGLSIDLRTPPGVLRAPPKAGLSIDLRTPPGVLRAPPKPALSIAQLRLFLESPIQAWAQTVLDLDELPNDSALDHSDEPFHVERPRRAVVLRDVLAAHLRQPETALAAHYDATVHELELRGHFPVGVFGAAARAVDLRTLEQWRQALGPVAIGAASRVAFGRSPNYSSRGAASAIRVEPAIELALGPGRTVHVVGSTELLLHHGDRSTSVVPILGTVDGTSRYHLRGAFDHLALAAAGLALRGHDHMLIDPDGGVRCVNHDPWTQADAQQFLSELARELLDEPHGYLLPFDVLARALSGSRSAYIVQDPTGGLGYGPIERRDGLDLPTGIQQLAERRLRPFVSRMRTGHSFDAS